MKSIICLAVAIGLFSAANALADEPGKKIEQLSRGTKWQLVETIDLRFDTFHPQGFSRVGDSLFMSSVEIIERTKKYEAPKDGYDRDTGKGAGHLFKLDKAGKLLGQISLGEGDIYHPGGIDFDGKWLWVPVAEYRPNSRSIIYRVDPESLEATEVMRFADHIGGLVYDPESKTLHGVSWGSRRFYAWPLKDDLTVETPGSSPEDLRQPNPSHYVDYQDCERLAPGKAVCTGITEFRVTPDAAPFGLGGIEIVDLKQNRPTFQTALQLWTDKGVAMTRNPALVEETAQGVRLTVAPDDSQTRIFVYETKIP